MPSCSAVGCTNRSGRGVQLFRFGADRDRKKLWMIKMRRANWEPTKDARLCSEHFDDDQFTTDIKGQRKLKNDAVPTIFQFPAHLMKKAEGLKVIRPTRTRPVSMAVESSTSRNIRTLVSLRRLWQNLPVKSEPHQAPTCLQRLLTGALPQCHEAARAVELAPLCFDSEAVIDNDNGDGGIIPSVDHNNAAVLQRAESETMDVDVYHDDDLMIDEDGCYIEECRANPETIARDHGYFKDSSELPPPPIPVVTDPDLEECGANPKTIACDHGYFKDSSELENSNVRELERNNAELQVKLDAVRQKLRLKNQQTRRLQSKVDSLKSMTKNLQQQLMRVKDNIPPARKKKRKVPPQRLPSVSPVSTQCFPSVPPVPPQCPPSSSPVSPQCLPSVPPVSTQCPPSASSVSPQCPPSAPPVPPQCAPECLPSVPPVPPQCPPSVPLSASPAPAQCPPSASNSNTRAIIQMSLNLVI